MITFKHRGNFKNTEKFFSAAQKLDVRNILHPYGALGVSALAAATPADTGETASSWSYSINVTRRGFTLSWTNSVIAGSVPLVILLQYGHGTGTGGYVEGRDFINPAVKPIFDKIAESAFKEVSGL